MEHDGLVYCSEKEAGEYDGLWATPDVEFWVEQADGIDFQATISSGHAPVRSGKGPVPLRTGDFDFNIGFHSQTGQPQADFSYLFRVQENVDAPGVQYLQWTYDELPVSARSQIRR